jgi:hypothetical protein
VCVWYVGSVWIKPSGRYKLMASYAAVQAIDPRLEALDNLANAAHLVEFDLQLVDFAQNSAEARDFGVGDLDRVTGAVVLHLGCGLCLLREL